MHLILITSNFFFNSNKCPLFAIRIKCLLTALDIPKFPVKSTLSVSREIDDPPWLIGHLPVKFSLTEYSKRATTPHVYGREFDKLLNEYGGWAKVFTDGSKTQDGVGAAAITGDQVKSASFPRQSSIFTEELYAIRLAVNFIAERQNG